MQWHFKYLNVSSQWGDTDLNIQEGTSFQIELSKNIGLWKNVLDNKNI